MTTKWKVIGHKKVKRDLGVYDVPVEAINLAEDIAHIDAIIALLRKVDSWNISESKTQEQRDWASDMLQSQIILLQTWRRYAHKKLATKFLAK